jgi:hypothetical protein
LILSLICKEYSEVEIRLYSRIVNQIRLLKRISGLAVLFKCVVDDSRSHPSIIGRLFFEREFVLLDRAFKLPAFS